MAFGPDTLKIDVVKETEKVDAFLREQVKAVYRRNGIVVGLSGGKDSWGKFDPKGREEIFSLIEKHRIPGVLLTSGDRHGARDRGGRRGIEDVEGERNARVTDAEGL